VAGEAFSPIQSFHRHCITFWAYRWAKIINPPSISQSCDLNPLSQLLSHFSLFDSQFFAGRDGAEKENDVKSLDLTPTLPLTCQTFSALILSYSA
jgi:hypothetical protein